MTKYNVYLFIGPSTEGQVFHRVETYNVPTYNVPTYNVPTYNVPELLIVSSSSSESDGECEIIGYVKPRHERTPEIIELLSSDSEHVSHISNENAR